MSLTYKSRYFQVIEKNERNHFWFAARNRLLGNLLTRFVPSPNGKAYIEVGCGTGVVLPLLIKLGFTVTGLDVNSRAILYARKKTNARLVRQSLYSYKTKEKYDCVGVFDVLEHQTNDRLFLRRCFDLLVPGGYIFLTVPAGKWLWTRIDAESGHKSRYEAAELVRVVRRAGFDVEFWNYWNALPLPFFLAKRAISSLGRSQGTIARYVNRPPWLINSFLYVLLVLEATYMFTVHYPVGASFVLCAKRPRSPDYRP